MVTIFTTCFNAHEVYFLFSYDSQSKQRLFPLTALTTNLVIVMCCVFFEARSECLSITNNYYSALVSTY
jgi:hypothetical protein